MATVGIDPGRNGGMAFVSRTELLEVKPLPYRHDRLDVFAVRAILNSWKFDQIVLEEVSTHFAASRSSSFSFGMTFGEIYALLRLETVPLILVRPQEWQKTVLGKNALKANPKDRALKFATNIWPIQNWHVGRQSNPHDGQVDAALIGFYGELLDVQKNLESPPDYSTP